MLLAPLTAAALACHEALARVLRARPAARTALLTTSGAAATAATVALGACAARPAPAGGPTPRPTIEAGAAEGGTGARPAPALPAAFAWSVGTHRGILESELTVQRDGDAAREVVRTRAVVRGTVGERPAGGGARPLTGVVDSLVVQAGARVLGDSTATADAQVTTGVRFRGVVDARAVRLDPESGVETRCGTPSGGAALAALGAARERFPRLAATLAVGARWRDTTVTATCAGPALVIVTTESRYEVAGVEADGTVRVTRRSTSTLRGAGTAGARPVQVHGTGSASWRYAVDPAAGDVRRGEGESRTTLAVTVAGVTERYTQAVRGRLEAR